jgi:metal-sulfur cluster biosynthetic enzyme
LIAPQIQAADTEISSKTMLTEADILHALRDCFDPVLPCNLVDLGTVRAVRAVVDLDAPGAGIAGVPVKHRVEIELAPAITGEEARAQLAAQIVNRMAGLETVSSTTVNMRNEREWTPADITPAGRRTLGLDGNPNLVQIR